MQTLPNMYIPDTKHPGYIFLCKTSEDDS